MREAIVFVMMVAVTTSVQAVGQAPKKSTLIEPKTRLWQATPTPDGKGVVTVTGDERTLRIWNLATGKSQTWEKGATDAGSVVFEPDGKTVLVGRRNGTVSRHDIVTGRELSRTPVGEEGEQKQPFFPLAAGSYGDSAFELSPDGNTIALSNPNGMTNTLVRWPRGTVVARLRNESRGSELCASRVGFGPGGKTLYCLCAGEGRGHVAVWDAETEKPTRVLVPPRTVSLMTVSRDGRWIGVGGLFNGAVTVWDAKDDFKQFDLRVPGGNCRGIAFSRDGKQAATISSAMGRDGVTAVVWDLETRQSTRTWAASTDFWLGGILFFSLDGRTLFTGGQTEGLHAWELSAP